MSKFYRIFLGIRKYCDDFLIYGIDQEDHDKNLRAVLDTVEKEGLQINEKVQFLGHIVSTKGVSPDPGKVKIIESFRAPKCKEELQTFLGRVLGFLYIYIIMFL